MRGWSASFKPAPLGAQYGYPKDQKWWSKLSSPPVSLGELLLKDQPEFQMLLWVDFSAGKVTFGTGAK